MCYNFDCHHFFNCSGSREDLSFDDSREESTDNAKGGYLNHPEGSFFEKLHSYGSSSKSETKQSLERFSDPKLGAVGICVDICLLMYYAVHQGAVTKTYLKCY